MGKRIVFIFVLYLFKSVVLAQTVDSIYQDNNIQVDTTTLNPESNQDYFFSTIDSSDVVPEPTQEIYEPSIKLSGFVPAGALMLYGITINGKNGLYSSYSIHKDIQTMFPNFYSPVDRYTQYVPLVAAYATGFIPGTKPRHSNGRRLWMFLQAQVITSVATLALKHYTHQLRPNGSDHLSFPSGHTVQAFMGAALFDVEYPGQMKAVKIGLYTLAGLTGAMAMLNDRHWASDVLFGAGMGIMSVRLLYWSEQHWKKKKLQPR